ncbi:MAG: hypothetical protein QOF36_2553 [Microbacteriaceae bacterium]|nr:hypothetical protein [Microbacteriaceae bacterium]
MGGWRGEGPPRLENGDGTLIVNETDLPDGAVQHAVATYFEESAAFNLGGNSNTFQMYANQGGSMLARPKFSPPSDVFGEMRLARDLAERDDDVGSTIGALVALAYGEGFQNTHPDEVTVALYDEIAKNMKLPQVQAEAYRELLITSQIISVTLFTRESYSFIPQGTDRYRTRTVTSPLLGFLPAEHVRVVGNDLFGGGDLYFLPPDENLKRWLVERFNPSTSAGRLAQMRSEDPVAYTLFTEEHKVSPVDPDDTIAGLTLYRLNPRMIERSFFPKGAWKYPRPLLTRNFALLEAKRLLNIMDYSLLQGGANYIVIAKKGSDAQPAQPGEVENLRDVVRRAGRSGVMVGDHRVSIDILTPELKELMNPDKRRLLGRKLSQAMTRVPEHTSENAGTEGMKSEVEILTRVVASDRKMVSMHIVAAAYEPTAKRNPNTFTGGPAKLWHPKIVLQGTNYFTDMILKLLDRGAIPLRYAVEFAGFDFEAAVEEKKRQKAQGLDEVMAPAPGQVPHSSPNVGPQDNGPGRTPGGDDPARPKRKIAQNPGETIKAIYDEEARRVTRVGERTLSILEDHDDTRSEGRVSAIERRVVETRRPDRQGPVRVVPVSDLEVSSLGAVRLGDPADTSLILGRRDEDDALVTVALSFRGPGSMNDAVKAAMEWGFDPLTETADEEHAMQHVTVGEPSGVEPLLAVLASAVASQASVQLPPITIHVPGQRAQRVLYDDDGRVKGTEPVED